VRISAAEQGEVWRFSVSDKGVGIDPAHHERIFEPCKRLGRHPGAGLGLTICRKIVTELGGDIWAASNPDGGTCFNFTVNRVNRSGADV
jgi:signal transduction histidine kinase